MSNNVCLLLDSLLLSHYVLDLPKHPSTTRKVPSSHTLRNTCKGVKGGDKAAYSGGREEGNVRRCAMIGMYDRQRDPFEF